MRRSTHTCPRTASAPSQLRFSYSKPPLQQMPVRDKELGPLIRNVFLPEEGEILGQRRTSRSRNLDLSCTMRSSAI